MIAPPGVEVGGRRPTLRAQRPPGLDFGRGSSSCFAPPTRPPAGHRSRAPWSMRRPRSTRPRASSPARVGPGCRVGAHSVIASNATLTRDVEVGCDCWIHPNVVVREDCRLGDRVVLQPGVVIGGDGFGYVADADGRPVAMAHRGRVVLEDDVEIGACTTVDRGTLDETRIRRGAKIDNHVQIAHNCDDRRRRDRRRWPGSPAAPIVGDRAILMARVCHDRPSADRRRGLRRRAHGAAPRRARRRAAVSARRRWRSAAGIA